MGMFQKRLEGYSS